MKKKDEVATVTPNTGIMATMPDYLREPAAAPRGGENLEPEDIIMPRLAICGKQSPQFDKNNDRFIDGLEMGDFFNTITQEVYGPAIYVVPLFEAKTRTRFPPYGTDGQVLCRSADGKHGIGDNPVKGDCMQCPLRQFIDDKRPECTQFLNYAVLLMPQNGKASHDVWKVLPRLDTASVLGFKSTALGSAKQWNAMLKMRGRDWFACVFKLKSTAKIDGKNSWYIPTVENAGWLSKEGFELTQPC